MERSQAIGTHLWTLREDGILIEVAIAAAAAVLGFRMYERDDMLHKVLGVGLVVYGLLGGFLWITVGVWPG